MTATPRNRAVLSLFPRTWTASLVQLRRDVSMVARGLAGEHPPPFRTRARPASGADGARDDAPDASRSDAASRLLAPRTLRIARVVRETADAVSLHLEDPMGAPLAFRPGQFFTVLLTLDGEALRRAYSISSASTDASGTVSITVKRVAGGRVSNHVNDHLEAGQTLQVLGPSGSFTVDPSADARRHVVLLAGGSGITPMMAIARSVLAVEPLSRVSLVYGNRGPSDVIFHDALRDLAATHEGRLAVRHVLSDPPPGWTGGTGLLEAHVVEAELAALGPLDGAEYFVCGPEPMMAAARATLLARGVSPDAIKEERFATPHLRVARGDEAAALDAPQMLTLRMNGETREMNVGPSQTVLEAALGAGLAMPYSCAMGGCAACKVKVCDGEVEMEEPNCLSAAERGEGYVLACVSRLKRATTVEVVG